MSVMQSGYWLMGSRQSQIKNAVLNTSIEYNWVQYDKIKCWLIKLVLEHTENPDLSDDCT